MTKQDIYKHNVLQLEVCALTLRHSARGKVHQSLTAIQVASVLEEVAAHLINIELA